MHALPWALQHLHDAGARHLASGLVVSQSTLVAIWPPAAESHQRHSECNLLHNIARLLCSASSTAAFQNVAFKWHDMSLQLSALADCKYGPQLARPEHLVKTGCNNTNSVGETDAESLCCCKFPHTSTAVQQGLGTSQTSWT